MPVCANDGDTAIIAPAIQAARRSRPRRVASNAIAGAAHALTAVQNQRSTGSAHAAPMPACTITSTIVRDTSRNNGRPSSNPLRPPSIASVA
jgi:hypothetical protein